MMFDKNKLSQEKKAEIVQLIEKSENKSEAIFEAIEKYAESVNEDLIQQVVAESEQARSNQKYKESLGLRTLSKKENEFYEMLKKPKQEVSGDQITIIPNTIVDRTLDNVRKRSKIAELLITFAPATVKKWIVASKTGKAYWGALRSELKEEMGASFEDINYELGKLYALLIIPKAIRELANEFVDKYLNAILNEAMESGVDEAFIMGTGVDMPIGITKLISAKNEDGTAKEKTKLTSIKNFSPKNLAPVKKTLSNNGKRSIGTLYLIANPSDVYEFVEPSLYGENLSGGYEQKSNTKVVIIESVDCPVGTGIFTIASAYSMGFSGITVNEYKETLADKDANLLIAKVNGNGRAVDDNTAVVFDITKLEEYVPTFKTLTAA